MLAAAQNLREYTSTANSTIGRSAWGQTDRSQYSDVLVTLIRKTEHVIILCHAISAFFLVTLHS